MKEMLGRVIMPNKTSIGSTVEDIIDNGNIKVPRPTDVIMGRGNGTASWKGNINFRKVIWEYRKEYLQSGRFEKTIVALRVLREISKLDPPGRFLQAIETHLDDKKSFVEISKERAIEKICQALREKTMKAPLDNCDSDSSHSGRVAAPTTKKKNTTKKGQSKVKKLKRIKKKTSRKKSKPACKSDSHGTNSSNMVLVRRSIRMNDARNDYALGDCSAYAMISPLKSKRLARNVGKTNTMQTVSIQSPPKRYGFRDTLPFEFCEGAQLNRESIMKMSRHVPTSNKMSNGYKLYRDYEVATCMKPVATTYGRLYKDIEQATMERPMEGTSIEIDTKNWSCTINDDDAAVAGTLINFDEYDFTFNDRETIGNDFYDVSNENSKGLKSDGSTDQGNGTGKPKIVSQKGRVLGFHQSLRDDTERGLQTTAWEDRFDGGEVDIEIDTKPASQEGMIRMITPTQEDFYDDLSDTSSLFSSESITPVDGAPWKIGVDQSDKNWLTPNVRKAHQLQQGAVMSSNHMHYRGKTLSNLYKAHKGPGQYDNVFDDDSIDGELVQWNSSVPV